MYRIVSPLKKRKVLQLCHDTKGPFIAICALYLKGFDLDRDEVHTVFLRGEYSQACVSALKGSSVHFLEMKGSDLRGLKIRAIANILKLCRQHQFDFIIAHRYKAIYIAGIASIFINVDVWGVAHTRDVFVRFGRKFLIEHWRKNIKLIGVSESVADNILSTCPSLINKNRVFSLPNCLTEDSESLLLSQQSARSHLGLDSDTFIFGTIGRLVDAKAHDILIQAYARTKLANTKLVIVGDGKNRPELVKLATSLNITERVLFAGHVPQALRVLSAFDTFVFPSNDDEAFGVAVLEAMMAKIPIICSDAKGPTEAAGSAGLTFRQADIDDLAKKMCLIYQLNSDERALMGMRGYQRWQSHYTCKQFRTRFSALLAPSESP